MSESPLARDRLITVYGRMPVLEALDNPQVTVAKVLLARAARGDSVDDIVRAAAARGVTIERVAPERVTRISRNGRHDQGVVADVEAPGVSELDAWLSDAGRPGGGDRQVVVLDGVTNPANVGMIIRSATAAGLAGIVLPRVGCPEVGPLVIKASAGVAFGATILRCDTARRAVASLSAGGYSGVGLAGGGEALWAAPLTGSLAIVLGNETDGVSDPVAELLDRWVGIPIAGGVDSLNVASAAAVVCFELARRRTTWTPSTE